MSEIIDQKKDKSSYLNKFLIVEIIALAFGSVYRYFLTDYYTSVILLGFMITAIIACALNKRGKFNWANHTFLILTNLLMFYSSLAIGAESGIYLFYFPIIWGYSFLLDLKDGIVLSLYFLLAATLFTMVQLDLHFLKSLKVGVVTKSYYQFEIMSVTAFLLVIYQTFLYLTDREKNQQYLINIINDLKLSEQKKTQTLIEKDILLAEVYHRVKNNLSVISSLINLQMNTIDHEYTKGVLLDCKNRINSMAMIHQKFYEQKNYAKIDFTGYIESLISEIKYAYSVKDKKIDVEVNVSPNLNFDLNVAIPCGIILNELISNCFKHAFKIQESGFIKVILKRQDNSILIQVVDNGVGFDFAEKSESSNSLGLILIQSLSEQIDGSFQYFGNTGTDFRLLFNIEKPKI